MVGDVHAEAGARFECLPDRNRIRLPFGLDRLSCSVFDRVPRRSVRRLVGEHAIHRSGGLQASGGVDDVACRHRLTLLGFRREPHERLSGSDPDSKLDPFLSRVPADRKGCSNSPLGIVLVRHRRTEQRHDRVADELLDRTAEALELGTEAFVVRGEERSHVLGVHGLGAFGEADEIREEDSDDLALLGQGISFIGTEIAEVALAYQMYQLTDSTLAVGLISLTHLVPLVTLTVVGGAIADAFDRRRVMLVQQCGMVAGSLGLAANAALGHPRVWPLYVFQFVISAAFSIGVGAQRSMTPQLVDESHFMAASALNSVTSQFGAVGGPGIAGLLIKFVDLKWVY